MHPEAEAAPEPDRSSNRLLRLSKGGPSSRFLQRALLVALVAAGFAVLLVFVVIPWLGRRGELNYILEQVISSAFDVPVRIDSMDSEPLGRLTITRLRSVSADAPERLEFAAEEITFFYDPVELLQGTLQEVRLRSPSLFVDLDAELGDVVSWPSLPGAPGGEEAWPFGLPFDVRRVVVESGAAVLRFEGRDVPVRDLSVTLDGSGTRDELAYRMRAVVLGAAVGAEGRLVLLQPENGEARYGLPRGRIAVEGLSLEALARWLDPESGTPPLAAGPFLDGAARAEPLVHSGRLALEGSVQGVWPERVVLRLVTRAQGIGAGREQPIELRSGRLELLLDAVVGGRVETADFDLSVLASGEVEAASHASEENLSAGIKGRFSREGVRGGTLLIETAQVELADGGSIHAHGTVSSLFSERSPPVAAAVDLEGVRLDRFLAFLGEELAPWLPLPLGGASGVVAGGVEVRGTLAGPVLAGNVEVQDASIAVRGSQDPLEGRVKLSFAGLELDPGGGGVRAASLGAEADGLEAERLSDISRGALPAFPRVRGLVRLELGVADLVRDRERTTAQATLRAALSGGGLQLESGFAEAAGLDATFVGRATIDTGADQVPFSGELSVNAEGVLIGDFYTTLRDEPLRLRGEGSVELAPAGALAAVSVESLELRSPLTGPVRGPLRLDRRPGGAFEIGARLHAAEIPVKKAFAVLVRDPYVNALGALEDAALEGRGTATLELEGSLEQPSATGTVELSGAKLLLGELLVEGLELVVPYAVGKGGRGGLDDRRGAVRFRTLRQGPIEIGATELPFALAGDSYVLTRSLALPLFGGTVSVERLQIDPWDEGGATGVVVTGGRGLSLAAITTGYRMPRIDGELAFRFQPLLYRGGRLDVDGSLAVSAFGGRFVFTDLAIEDVFEPYGSLHLGMGRIEDVRLGELGKTFRFGVLSGVLRGVVEDLEITAGELTGFHLDVETVPGAGVPQFVDRRAVASIRRVLSGAAGREEATGFSKLYYHRFGFAAALAGDVLRLRGKYREDGVEYLMYGRWYQFPRIRIINARPGRAYDWSRLVTSLEEIYTEDAPREDSGGSR